MKLLQVESLHSMLEKFLDPKTANILFLMYICTRKRILCSYKILMDRESEWENDYRFSNQLRILDTIHLYAYMYVR